MRSRLAAVKVVPGKRMADGRKMHPDLVGAASHRHAGRKAKAVFFLYNSILSAAGLALGGNAAPDDAVAPAADGCIDDPFPQRQRTLRDGIVQFFHPVCQ